MKKKTKVEKPKKAIRACAKTNSVQKYKGNTCTTCKFYDSGWYRCILSHRAVIPDRRRNCKNWEKVDNKKAEKSFTEWLEKLRKEKEE